MGRSAVQKTLGQILIENDDIEFHVGELVESARFIDQAKERFRSFQDSFDQPVRDWSARRDEIRQAVAGVAAYDGIDWSRDDYWETIPLVDKSDLRARNDDFVHPGYDRSRLWLRPTSGTTGPPVDIWFSQAFHFEFHLFLAFKVTHVAGRLTPEVLERAITCVALVDNKDIPNRLWVGPDGYPGPALRLRFDERDPATGDWLLGVLERHRPAILTLKPNILASMVRLLGDRGVSQIRDLELVISGGAPLRGELRRDGENLLGAPIYDAYGLSEVGLIASECALQDGMHVYGQDMLLEVLLDDGTLTRYGNGELVVSSVANLAMPLLRYRTGDRVELGSSPCPCGKKGDRILRLTGRAIRSFTFPDGTEYYPANLKALFRHFPLREFRLTQTALDRLHAEVEFLPSCPDTDRDREERRIRDYISDAVERRVEVEVSRTTFCADDKFQRYRPFVARGPEPTISRPGQ